MILLSYGIYMYAGDSADTDDSSAHDDTDDPLGVTAVTTVIKRSKRKRS
jgi:hypothetical protein